MYMFFRKLVEIYFRCKYELIVLNGENIPKQNGGFVIASNHQSYSDPPVIASVFHGRFSFMAKAELFKNKLFAFIITRCGAFPVVRGAKDSFAIDRAVSDLRNNKIFVIFPEGTRSKDGRLAKAKSGVAMIAGMSDAPVLPVCIMYGCGGKKRRCVLAVGKLIDKESLAITDITDRKRLKAVSELIMNNISNLQKQICEHYNMPLFIDKSEAQNKLESE